jgi:hypothetical protein
MKTSDVTADIARAHRRLWALREQWHIQLEILTLDPPRCEGTISPQSRTWPVGGTQHGNPSRPPTNDRPDSAHLTASVAHT